VSGEPKVAGHAFLSYVREDSAAVEQLERMLRAAGVSVWRAVDLRLGADWRVQIREAITRDTLAFIVCFSTSSVNRKTTYQHEELTLAIEQLRIRNPSDNVALPRAPR
jgi:hypothetical protein